jgi:hypothetical protein
MYGIGCYAPDQEWADPEHDALVEAMREAATQRLGPDLEAWARLNKKFGVDTIGTQLSALLHKARDEAAEEESDDDWE